MAGSPIAELTAVDDLLAEIQRLGSEEVQQPGLEGPLGVSRRRHAGWRGPAHSFSPGELAEPDCSTAGCLRLRCD